MPRNTVGIFQASPHVLKRIAPGPEIQTGVRCPSFHAGAMIAPSTKSTPRADAACDIRLLVTGPAEFTSTHIWPDRSDGRHASNMLRATAGAHGVRRLATAAQVHGANIVVHVIAEQ